MLLQDGCPTDGSSRLALAPKNLGRHPGVHGEIDGPRTSFSAALQNLLGSTGVPGAGPSDTAGGPQSFQRLHQSWL
jgi:hypothetical protein